MKSLEWITNKFKSNNHKVKKDRDNVFTPTREYLKDDENIKLLEEYKKRYLDELNQKNLISTLNFNSNDLRQNMKMSIDLIFRILKNNNNFYNYASEELMIQINKLEMYYEEINVLEEEAIIRLIALSEIKEKKKMPNHNRMILEEEINKLKATLDMYSYGKEAINTELDNYKASLKSKVENEHIINEPNIIESSNNIFKERLRKLLILSKGIYNVEEIKKYKDLKLKIAFLEHECERYSYLNKDKIEKLKEELNELSKIDINDNKLNELKTRCIKLENKLLLFYYYGKNLISKDDLRELYDFKFKILTHDIYSQKDSPIDKNDNGLPYYQEIIQQKLEKIIKRNNSCFNNKFSSEKIKLILQQFINFYLNEIHQFDYKEILSNKLKLSLLLSFDTYDGLNIFYKKIKISDTDYNKIITYLSNKYVTFEENASILALFEFSGLEKPNELLYSMYKNTYIYPSYEEMHIFPEGISRLEIGENSTFLSGGTRRKFAYLFNTNIIYIPSTLKTLDLSDLLIGSKPQKIIFNNGIQDFSISYCDGLELVFSPSLSSFKISKDKHNVNRINNLNLTFYNYEDSHLLRDDIILTLKNYLIDYSTKYKEVKINDNYYGKDRTITVKPVFNNLKLLSKNEHLNNFTRATTKPSVVFSNCDKYAKTVFLPAQDFLDKADKVSKCKEEIINELINLFHHKTNHVFDKELIESEEEKPKILVK